MRTNQVMLLFIILTVAFVRCSNSNDASPNTAKESDKKFTSNQPYSSDSWGQTVHHATNTQLKVHGHRGAAAVRPENTILGFKYAVTTARVYAIELDLRYTSDNVIILCHDPSPLPSQCLTPTGGHLPAAQPLIASTTWEELKKYDCGTLLHEPKRSIPTLSEAFETVESLKPATGLKPYYDLHIKWDGPNPLDPATYVQAILQVINSYGISDRINIVNDTEPILSQFQQQAPTIRRYYLVGSVTPDELALAARVQATGLLVLSSGLTQATVDILFANNYEVIPWTENDPARWGQLKQMGVNGIMTDNPQGLSSLLSPTDDPQLNRAPGSKDSKRSKKK
jgi:glycerophosphoryl diester phosphodiesterase